MKKILITVNGKDKPGIIAKVSGLLFARGCNLESGDFKEANRLIDYIRYDL